MKLTSKLRPLVAATAVATASMAAPTVVQAEVSANVGVTSNYIWRGMPQSSDEAAISGGLDYSHSSGFYAGTWVSSIGGGSQYEQDWYFGYGFKLGGVELDAGYIAYTYPVGNAALDFDEIYLNATFGMFKAGVAYTVDKEASTSFEDDLYYYVGGEFSLKKDVTLGVTLGKTDFDDPASTDVTHYQVSLAKGDFTFAVDKTNQSAAAGDPRFSVSWSKSFDL